MKQLVRDSSSEEIVEMAERHDKAAERHEQEAKRKRVRDVGLWAKARRGWRRKKGREVSRRGLRGAPQDISPMRLKILCPSRGASAWLGHKTGRPNPPRKKGSARIRGCAPR